MNALLDRVNAESPEVFGDLDVHNAGSVQATVAPVANLLQFFAAVYYLGYELGHAIGDYLVAAAGYSPVDPSS